MKIKFDSNQQYQLNAIEAVVGLLEGQPKIKGDFNVTLSEQEYGPMALKSSELGLGNRLSLTPHEILQNLKKVQEKNDLEITSELFNSEAVTYNSILNFSIEMETGTGKTYCYLRTVFELNQLYGFSKFIIVVPSVAIREGTLKNLEITKEHFQQLYSNIQYEHFVYDAKRRFQLRNFARSNQLQIQVINIDAFLKKESNVIYQESDQLSGRKAIEYIQAVNPIVIIDEPQSVDNTEKSKEAIASLNPLFILRYSATHRNPYNLVYKLDPVQAYELKLVKQIIVSSVTSSEAYNEAFLKVEDILYDKGKNSPIAKVRIHVQQKSGPKERTVKVGQDSDLWALSNERDMYRNGYEVTEISAEPGNEYIQLSSGKKLRKGEEQGSLQADVWRVQIKRAIEKHLQKEKQLKDRGIKVLSLFFVDKVANYRSYDEEGKPVKGKFAVIFEEIFKEIVAKEPSYQGLIPFEIDKLHNGYFAADKKGVLKDTTGTTQADDDVYSLIMKDKERLLSAEEPLRFIFSHSALREGWDNPNVFQICTLNESTSAIKKRQEIGRGLRLPVNKDGERVFDPDVNRLTVIANESYDDFARALQTEYEEDCGVTFGKLSLSAFAKLGTLVADETEELGKERSKHIVAILKEQGFIDEKGRITEAFTPESKDFKFNLPEEYEDLREDIVDTVLSYRLDRHIKPDQERRRVKLNKEVYPDLEEFKLLWEKIKQKTRYRVEFSTDDLVKRCLGAIKEQMPKIKPARIDYTDSALDVKAKGIETAVFQTGKEEVSFTGRIPDVLTYLENETELTRSTIARILIDSGRLDEFLINPQKYMDSVAEIMRSQLHSLIVDGIKYEKIEGEEYEMRLFEEQELVTYLEQQLKVHNSVYEEILYDSDIERRFAESLDVRDDIKLFVKLPWWFQIETPMGSYNPDWAIVKNGASSGEAYMYLVAETKGNRNFLKLRGTEQDKIRCGMRHFETLDVEFQVATAASEI